MPKTITLLGSTGSIGTQSLDVARMHGYRIFGLAANSRVEILQKQIEEFHPEYVAVVDPAACEKLDAALAGTANAPKLLKGPEGLRTLAAMDGPDVVLNAVVGIAGLPASLAAIESGHDLALANKESLVTGGHLVTDAVKKYGVKLLPVETPPGGPMDKALDMLPELLTKVSAMIDQKKAAKAEKKREQAEDADKAEEK